MTKHRLWVVLLFVVTFLLGTATAYGHQPGPDHGHHPAGTAQAHDCHPEHCDMQQLPAHAHHDPAGPDCRSLAGHCSGALGTGSTPLLAQMLPCSGFARPDGHEKLTAPLAEFDTPPPKA